MTNSANAAAIATASPENHTAPPGLKLNLGCGSNKFEGFENVDLYGEPDRILDLEAHDWPWPDNSAEIVVMNHVLEHLGRDFAVFNRIIQNVYRVCRNGGKFVVAVPHPRHDNFIGDPTHVRIVTPQVMSLYDKAQCLEWQKKGFANTPLALYHGVDFRMIECVAVPDWKYEKMPRANLDAMARELNNVICEFRMAFEVVK